MRQRGFDLNGRRFLFKVFLCFASLVDATTKSRLPQLTIVHLFPSSSFLEGFLTLILSGLGFFPGAGLFGRAESETVAAARREGFLCVISDLSTLRRPLVTDSPLLSSEKTAPRPPAAVGAAGAASVLISSTGGGPGGGGGGGGGGPPAAGGDVEDVSVGDAAKALATAVAESPLGFHWMPLG